MRVTTILPGGSPSGRLPRAVLVTVDPPRRRSIENLSQLCTRTLPAVPSSASEARRLVRATLQDWGLEVLLDDALLLTSELVANAVTHAGTDAELAVSRLGEGVMIAVTDYYAARPVPLAPVLPAADSEGQRGLFLLSEVADRWGVDYVRTSKRVWFALGERAGDEAQLLPQQPVPVDALVGGGVERTARPLDELLRQLMATVLEELDGDAAYCYLAGDDDVTYELRASLGDAEQRRTLPRVRTREGLAGRVSQRALPVVIDDTLSGPPAVPVPDRRHRSVLAAPVTTSAGQLGVVYCTATAPGRFGSDDAVRLQQIVDARTHELAVARAVDIDRRRRGWLSYLAQASELLASTLDPEMTAAMMAQLVVPRLAEWCVIHDVLPDGTPRLAHVWHVDESRLDALRADDIGLPPVETAAQGVSLHAGPGGADSVLRLTLEARTRRLAVVTFGRDSAPYGTDEIRVVEDLTRRASLAYDNAHLHAETTRVAAALQESLLPSALPELPGCEVAAAFQPSGRVSLVGGDFYDVFRVDADRFAFAVGDVCGKGPAAAAVTGLARHALRLLSRSGHGPSEVLQRLNDAILDEGERARFMTLLFGVFTKSPDGLHVELCCAGHPLPMVVSADGAVRSVGSPQSLLGVLDDVEFVPDRLVLRPGETLVCFTDGVTERRNGHDMLGEGGLRAVLSAAAGGSAGALVRSVRDAVTHYADAPPGDDVAVLAVRLADRGAVA